MYFLQVCQAVIYDNSSSSFRLLTRAVTVDAHTAHHLYHECLKGELMKGRTIILVSHHVQLCAPGASYIVSLSNGRISYSGDLKGFKSSGVMATLVQSEQSNEAKEDVEEEKSIEEGLEQSPSTPSTIEAETAAVSETDSTLAAPSETSSQAPDAKKKPRKLIEEEKRAVGRIGKEIWGTYFGAIGGKFYWPIFFFVFLLGALSPVVERGWLRCVIDVNPRMAWRHQLLMVILQPLDGCDISACG